jgi:trimeric autotransporter adhesin
MKALLPLICSLTALAQPVPGTITTFAGNGRAPFNDDGKKAVDAQLYDIYQVTIDGSNNLYFADYYYDRVFKIGTDGVLKAIAGNDQFGSDGDGGLGTKASLYGPRAVSAAPDGTVYIGDVLNDRIRKVTPDGIITTAAGGGDFYGSGVQGPSANLACPESVAVSSSGYIGFLTQCDLRFLVMYPGGLLYTYGGNGAPGPIVDGGLAYKTALGRSLTGLAVDDSLNWYLSTDNRIRRVDGRTYNITTIGGSDAAGFSGDGGPATAALFNTPFRLSVDKTGNVYVPDRFN